MNFMVIKLPHVADLPRFRHISDAVLACLDKTLFSRESSEAKSFRFKIQKAHKFWHNVSLQSREKF